MGFPFFKTKIDGASQKFNLTNPEQRQAYFELKAGPEIRKIREYLENKTFIAYLLGKKNSGKGTYSKMFAEVVAPEKVAHFSIGDMIRDLDKDLKDEAKKKELLEFLKDNFRGFVQPEEALDILEGRSTQKLLPTELILALAKKEIAKRGRRAIFIDGFPRDMDQISFSLFFRELVEYREDPDIFVLIDVPDSVIDERIKWRRICPLCQTSRNLKLLPTSKVGYKKETREFYLMCDNPACPGDVLVSKEGDELGIEPIKKRLEKDAALIKEAFSLYGIPKVALRNAVPVDKANEYVDDYELTPAFDYKFNEESGQVSVIEKPWQAFDNEGVMSYSLMPPPVVVSLIKQLAAALKL